MKNIGKIEMASAFYIRVPRFKNDDYWNPRHGCRKHSALFKQSGKKYIQTMCAEQSQCVKNKVKFCIPCNVNMLHVVLQIYYS